MAIEPRLKYEGNIEPSSDDYPYGSARDDSTETSADGTPLQRAWLNDLFGLQQALLTEAGITPSNNPDTALSSQYLEAIRQVVAGANVSWLSTQSAGTERLAAIDADILTPDTTWTSEITWRLLFQGTYRIEFDQFTTSDAGDGFQEARIMVNGVQSGDVEQAPADGVWYTRTRDIALEDGDIVTLESRMSAGSPPREGRVRNRSINGSNFRLHALCSVGNRTTGEDVSYEPNS